MGGLGLFFVYRCPIVPVPLLEKAGFLPFIAFASLSEIIWAYLCESTSGASVLSC